MEAGFLAHVRSKLKRDETADLPEELLIAEYRQFAGVRLAPP